MQIILIQNNISDGEKDDVQLWVWNKWENKKNEKKKKEWGKRSAQIAIIITSRMCVEKWVMSVQ